LAPRAQAVNGFTRTCRSFNAKGQDGDFGGHRRYDSRKGSLPSAPARARTGHYLALLQFGYERNASG
jgi:hypothetical protein